MSGHRAGFALLVRRTGLGVVAAALVWLLVPMALAEPDRGDVRDAEERLRELEIRHQTAVEEYLQAEQTLAELDDDISRTQGRVAELAERSEERRDLAGRVIQGLYRGEEAAGLEAVLGAGRAADAARRAAYLAHAQDANMRALESYQVVRRDLEHETDALRAARQEAAELQQEMAARAERIDADAETQRAEVASLQQQVAEREERERQQAERERREQQAREAAERAEQEAEATQVASNDDSGDDDSGDEGTQASGDTDNAGGGAPPPSGQAAAAVDAALSRQGKPYQWGATGPDRFDCSGLTQWAWKQAGVSIPRTSRQQYAGLPKVSRSELQPGDLVFFGDPIHHMAMYIGDGQMVEAPYSGQSVRVRSMDRDDYTGAARPGG